MGRHGNYTLNIQTALTLKIRREEGISKTVWTLIQKGAVSICLCLTNWNNSLLNLNSYNVGEKKAMARGENLYVINVSKYAKCDFIFVPTNTCMFFAV